MDRTTAAVICLLTVIPYALTAWAPAAFKNQSDSDFGIPIAAVFIVATLAYIRWRIAGWHGAEHMAIAAYERSGSVTIESMLEESPIDKNCGGRLLLPLSIAIFIAMLGAEHFGINLAITDLLAIEVVLQVDHRRGWHTIPLAAQASQFLQRWITTKDPTVQELKTAQLALCTLVAID
jgi:uncharacterized protein YqhQ